MDGFPGRRRGWRRTAGREHDDRGPDPEREAPSVGRGLNLGMRDAYEEYAASHDEVRAEAYFRALYEGAELYLDQQYNFTLRPSSGSILEMIFE